MYRSNASILSTIIVTTLALGVVACVLLIELALMQLLSVLAQIPLLW